jgi:hypothetical protein
LHLAQVDDRHPVAKPRRFLHIVRGQQDRLALRAYIPYQIPDDVARLRVQERKHPKLYWADPGLPRVLKRQGQLGDKLAGAFRTGIIMTTTTLAAVLSLWVVSILGQIEVIRDMAAVLLIGLVLDIVNTWITNATLLKWYVERRGS